MPTRWYRTYVALGTLEAHARSRTRSAADCASHITSRVFALSGFDPMDVLPGSDGRLTRFRLSESRRRTEATTTGSSALCRDDSQKLPRDSPSLRVLIAEPSRNRGWRAPVCRKLASTRPSVRSSAENKSSWCPVKTPDARRARGSGTVVFPGGLDVSSEPRNSSLRGRPSTARTSRREGLARPHLPLRASDVFGGDAPVATQRR
jgi:hypothetical protein